MDKNSPPQTLWKELPFFLLFGAPLIAFIAFSSTEVFWVSSAYDGWRIFEIILLIFLSIYIFFSSHQITTLSKHTIQYLGYGLFLAIGMIFISALNSQHPGRSFSDAALYSLLALGVLAQAQLLRQKIHLAPKIAAIISVLPILTTLFLFIGITQTIQTSQLNDWHQSFNNIRMLDDALLPCLFLLWQRPAWLSTNPSKSFVFNLITTLTVYTLSITYFLVFFFDGARASFLSIFIGLFFIAYLRRDQWKNLQLPSVSFLASGSIYLVLIHSFPALIYMPLARTDSSDRNLLWQKAWDLWLSSPLFGIGGDNYVLAQPWRISGHPHNIFIQLISEWGIGGLLALLCLTPTVILIFRYVKVLPAFAFAATVAIVMDASISGLLVYPLSQILGLWSLAWLIASLPTQASNEFGSITQSKQSSKLKLTAMPLYKIGIKFIAILAIMMMLATHGKDIICVHCESVDAFSAPRFWLQGRAMHLTPSTQAAVMSQ